MLRCVITAGRKIALQAATSVEIWELSSCELELMSCIDAAETA